MQHEMAGRKPKRAEDRMTASIRIPMTPKLKERFEAFRDATGHDLATWARKLLLVELERWETRDSSYNNLKDDA